MKGFKAILMVLTMFVMVAITNAAHKTVFQTSIQKMEVGIDQGVPCQFAAMEAANCAVIVKNIEVSCSAQIQPNPDYCLPWSNDGTVQSQVLTAELPNNLYDVSEPVFRIKSQFGYLNNYKSQALQSIDRYSDLHHNFG